MKRRLVAALAGLLTLAACVEGIGPAPEACNEAAVEIQLSLSADALEPSDPAACRGQEVTLVIEPELDGVFHIHGYNEEVPATEVRAGEPITLEFTAARSGQFPIEVHPADAPDGVEVGVFTVHEP